MENRRWSHQQRNRISELAKELTMRELADHYGVKYSTMYSYCLRQNIKAVSEKPRWPREVKAFILNNREMSNAELAKATGRNEGSIRHLLSSVYGPRWRKPWRRNEE